jgi:hypothetical protein
VLEKNPGLDGVDSAPATTRRYQRILESMTVNLTPHGQELVEAALARGVGRSPEEVVERALEATTGTANGLSAEERERRRQAVAAMLAFREEYHLTLGPGERIQDLVHEGHKY